MDGLNRINSHIGTLSSKKASKFGPKSEIFKHFVLREILSKN